MPFSQNVLYELFRNFVGGCQIDAEWQTENFVSISAVVLELSRISRRGQNLSPHRDAGLSQRRVVCLLGCATMVWRNYAVLVDDRSIRFGAKVKTGDIGRECFPYIQDKSTDDSSSWTRRGASSLWRTSHRKSPWKRLSWNSTMH